MSVTVEQVRAEVTLPLRRRVLRPHQTLAELAAEDRPGTVHHAAFAGGAVVGCASVRPEPPPWDPGAPSAWRLRGMATDPDRRSTGVGAAVLAAATRFVVEQDARLVWCSARIPALAFYVRHGWVEHGERWEDPHIGPHVHALLHPLALRTHVLQQAVAGRDGARLDALLHPDFVLATGRPGAEQRTRAEYLEITATRYEIDDHVFEWLVPRTYGDAGVVRSRYRQTGRMDGADRSQAFLMTDVWVGAEPRLVTRHAQPLQPR